MSEAPGPPRAAGDLHGAVALVTGAGQGLGRGVALALADRGAHVVALGRTLEKLEKTAEEVRGRGVRALALAGDVAARADVDGAVAAVRDEFGRLDVLVNNAQTVALGPVLGIRAKDVARTWESGFVGTLNCMQACFPLLRASDRAAVVNVGSGSALRPDPAGYGLYAAVKEAVRALTRAAAVEWGPEGVRVNAVVPLALSPGLQLWSEYRPEEFAAFVGTVPLGRVGDCEVDVGRPVAFLASPAAGYITGSTLMIDGGQAYLR